MADADRLTQLLAASADGDEDAFARLYRLSSPHLFSLLLRMLKRRDWAEEALQDCYLKIWQKADSYAPDKGAPLTWLMTVARHRALDLLRARRPEQIEAELGEDEIDPVSQAADPAADPQARAAEREGLDRMERCMKGLQEQQRTSVLLAYYEGYTHQELARRMSAPLGTVKAWVRRGLLRLRECLEAAA